MTIENEKTDQIEIPVVKNRKGVRAIQEIILNEFVDFMIKPKDGKPRIIGDIYGDIMIIGIDDTYEKIVQDFIDQCELLQEISSDISYKPLPMDPTIAR